MRVNYFYLVSVYAEICEGMCISVQVMPNYLSLDAKS